MQERPDGRRVPSAVGSAALSTVLGADPPPFALLYRPESTGADQLEILVGDVRPAHRLVDLPLPPPIPSSDPQHDVLAVIPFRQVRERGFECRDDAAPILAMTVRAQGSVPLAEALDRLPAHAIRLTNAGFDIDDDQYASIVRQVITQEIGDGAGSNFVIKRSLRAQLAGSSLQGALALFRGLLVGESGAYWTFLVRTGEHIFVGATPERQVSVLAGEIVMNPISGTYRYLPTGPSVSGALAFLADRKEAGELCMVVDEELKMMASICRTGGRVVGPYLKEMARLAHTEYLLHGHSLLDVREVLRRTLVAPTVTGSPLENACRVIARHETIGRGYYSGVLAVMGRDSEGRRELDSAILIRTADIDLSGAVEIGVGATLVRDSDPAAEVAETRVKAAGLLAAASTGHPVPSWQGRDGRSTGGRGLATDHRVRAALRRRNATLAQYWFDVEQGRPQIYPGLAGRRVLVLDAEDSFTAMLAAQLRSLQLVITLRPCLEAIEPEPFDLVVLGPGPGDPRDLLNPRIIAIRRMIGRLLCQAVPFFCVCLSHQVLAAMLGLDLVRKRIPHQGLQRKINLFGRWERVGFYNTFVACAQQDLLYPTGVSGPLQVSRDPHTGEVYALRGLGFASTQFHPESLLTQNGVHIMAELVDSVLRGRPVSVLEPSG